MTDKPDTYTVRSGRAGEAMVTAPNGRVQFMGVWQFFLFCLRIL